MPTIAELLIQAIRHHERGQLVLTENLYRQILQADPHQGHAWHLLGLQGLVHLAERHPWPALDEACATRVA